MDLGQGGRAVVGRGGAAGRGVGPVGCKKGATADTFWGRGTAYVFGPPSSATESMHLLPVLAAVALWTPLAAAQTDCGPALRFGLEGSVVNASFLGSPPPPVSFGNSPSRDWRERGLTQAAGGAFAEVRLRERVWLHVGARYAPKGMADTVDEVWDGTRNEERFNDHVDYLEAPVLLRLDHVAGPLSVSAGPFVAVKLREVMTARQWIDGEPQPGFAQQFVVLADRHRDVDAGAVVAADVAWRRARVGVRATAGALDATRTDDPGTWRGTRTVELTGALRLR